MMWPPRIQAGPHATEDLELWLGLGADWQNIYGDVVPLLIEVDGALQGVRCVAAWRIQQRRWSAY